MPANSPILLQRDVELRYQFLLLFSYVLFAIELDLKSKFPHKRLMLAPSAPQPDVTLGNNAFAEVQLTKRKQHFLHDASVHQ